jgi:hypothetical protein
VRFQNPLQGSSRVENTTRPAREDSWLLTGRKIRLCGQPPPRVVAESGILWPVASELRIPGEGEKDSGANVKTIPAYFDASPFPPSGWRGGVILKWISAFFFHRAADLPGDGAESRAPLPPNRLGRYYPAVFLPLASAVASAARFAAQRCFVTSTMRWRPSGVRRRFPLFVFAGEAP